MESILDFSEMSMEDVIVYFRSQYDELYISEINGSKFIWRTLRQKEYRQIVEFSTSENEAFERVCHMAILYPNYDYVNFSLAYLPETLGAQILDKSGYGKFSKEFDILNEYREEMGRFDRQAEVLVNRAFPYITFEAMEDWTRTKLLKFLAKAEWSLQFIDRMHHVRLLSEEEIAEEARMAQQEGEEVDETLAPASTKTEEELLREAADNIRRSGGDAMLELYPIFKKPTPDYIDLPMIGGEKQLDGMIQGVDSWRGGVKSDGRFETIRESVQKISARRK